MWNDFLTAYSLYSSCIFPGPSTMNNTTLGNCSSAPFCVSDNSDPATIYNLFSPILRLPVNIYILQLIISKQWITTEFYSFQEAIFEIIICLQDVLGIAVYFSADPYLFKIRRFFVGFIVTGRPCLLAVICVERYLAITKPVVYLRLKPLKFKLVLSGLIWLVTLLFCWGSIFMSSEFHKLLLAQMAAWCVVKLYCCGATLVALRQPGPGDGVRQREGMSAAKRKAFRIILVITASVIFTYVPLMIINYLKHFLTEELFLNILNVGYSCTAFAGFVQSLLFIQRCGKLPFMKWP